MLALHIVGGAAAPASAPENTIWIQTDQEITGWVFSAKEPADPKEGLVWIATGTNSPVKINALKREAIELHVLMAKQWTDGAWVNKGAQLMNGGSWAEWTQYLYSPGNLHEEVTGGWSTIKSSTELGSAATVEFRENGIYIAGESTTGSIVYPLLKFDLTNISTISIVSEVAVAFDTSGLHVYEVFARENSLSVASCGMKGSIDVSALEGEYYIGILCENYYLVDHPWSNLLVTQIRME